MPRKPSARIRSAASKMNNEYCRVKTMLMIFKLFGLGPWNIELTTPKKTGSTNNVPRTLRKPRLTHSTLGSVYQIVIVVITVVIWISTLFTFSDLDYPNKTELTMTLELVITIFSNILVIAIRMKLCVQQNTVIKLFNRFTNVGNDVNVRRYENFQNSKSIGIFVILMFAIDNLSWASIIMTNKWCFGQIFDELFISILPAMTVTWFMMQYVIAVNMIELRFRALNRDLVDISNFIGIRSIPSSILDDSPMRIACSPKIIDFRRNHTELYEIACEVSEFYSLPILMSMAYLCLGIIYASYYVVVAVLSGVEKYSPCLMINGIGWLTGPILPIIMLAAGTDRTNSEMRKTADVVHGLIARSSAGPEDRYQLQRFSLEVLRREIDFSAYGLFSLNRTILHSMFSTIVTYLIILVQFHLGDITKPADEQK